MRNIYLLVCCLIVGLRLQAQHDSCTAGFTYAVLNAGPVAQLVSFSPQYGHNQQKPVTQVCYQFGDGRDTCIHYPAATPAPGPVSHLYAQPGTYNVCITITYDGGCHSSFCHGVPLTTAADSCHATVSVEPSAAGPMARRFFAAPAQSNGLRVMRICWQFGDGRDTCIAYAPGYTGPYDVAHTYAQYGTYNVCAQVLFDGGCQAAACTAVTVHPVTPSPVDTVCHTGFGTHGNTAPLSQHFEAWANGATHATELCWDFGDGHRVCVPLRDTSTSAAYNIDHTYAAPGNYTVCVRVRFANGCESHYCHDVHVFAPHSHQLTLAPNPVSAELHVNFLSGAAQGTATIRIVSATGIVLRTETRPCVPGMNQWSLNVGTLPTGLYRLNVQTGTESVWEGFFKR